MSDEKVTDISKVKKKRTFIDDIADKVGKSLIEEADKTAEVVKFKNVDYVAIPEYFYKLIEELNNHVHMTKTYLRLSDWVVDAHNKLGIPEPDRNPRVDFINDTLANNFRLLDSLVYYIPRYIYVFNTMALKESVPGDPVSPEPIQSLYMNMALSNDTALFIYTHQMPGGLTNKDRAKLTHRFVDEDKYVTDVRLRHDKIDADHGICLPDQILKKLIEGFSMIAARYSGGYAIQREEGVNRIDLITLIPIRLDSYAEVTLAINLDEYDVWVNDEQY